MDISRNLRLVFAGVLLLMLGIAIYAVAFRPRPVTEADIEATVQAEVAVRQQETISAVTPDIQGTVEARLQTTPTPPNPADTVSNTVNSVGGFFGGVWDFFGFLGIFSQVLCCILLPGLIILGVLRDPPRR